MGSRPGEPESVGKSSFRRAGSPTEWALDGRSLPVTRSLRRFGSPVEPDRPKPASPTPIDRRLRGVNLLPESMRCVSPSPFARWPRPNAALRPSLPVAARMRLAREAAAFLRSKGADRVWLFGSLAKGRRQDWRSDLDLAVAGLAPAKFLGALGELLLRLPIKVDLVEMETASGPLRRQILDSGLPLDAD